MATQINSTAGGPKFTTLYWIFGILAGLLLIGGIDRLSADSEANRQSGSNAKDADGGVDGFGDIETGDISVLDNFLNFSDNYNYQIEYQIGNTTTANNTLPLIIIGVIFFVLIIGGLLLMMRSQQTPAPTMLGSVA